MIPSTRTDIGTAPKLQPEVVHDGKHLAVRAVGHAV